jgi:allophanate hydrolase subunit 2
MAGQQWDAFSKQAQTLFCKTAYRITPQSDRMGYRIEGASLALRKPLEMISEAVGFGTIQIPRDGNPIILMADRQTTGGYPKIAQVASVDLPLLAQMLPPERLCFSVISLEVAQQLCQVREQELQRLRHSINQLKREK